MFERKIAVEELDTEWVELIQYARSIGLSIEEVQAFFSPNEDQLIL